MTANRLWPPIQARFALLVEQGGGVAPWIVPPGTFHARRVDRPLDDPQATHADYDRAYEVRFLSRDGQPQNRAAPVNFCELSCALLLGAEVPQYAVTTESGVAGAGDSTLTSAMTRAVDDAQALEMACTITSAWGTLATGLDVYGCVANGPAGGRLVTPRRWLYTLPLKLLVQYDASVLWTVGA